jgi:hypothetical protein
MFNKWIVLFKNNKRPFCEGALFSLDTGLSFWLLEKEHYMQFCKMPLWQNTPERATTKKYLDLNQIFASKTGFLFYFFGGISWLMPVYLFYLNQHTIFNMYLQNITSLFQYKKSLGSTIFIIFRHQNSILKNGCYYKKKSSNVHIDCLPETASLKICWCLLGRRDQV